MFPQPCRICVAMCEGSLFLLNAHAQILTSAVLPCIKRLDLCFLLPEHLTLGNNGRQLKCCSRLLCLNICIYESPGFSQGAVFFRYHIYTTKRTSVKHPRCLDLVENQA
ncbi:hypothetical protein IW262DRAFT_1385628 [Armillaria fumosa]|nr:hypothetical protein IW262DRAFT_1385628 [Armillaria fumosa]